MILGVVVTLDGELHDPAAPLLHADDLAVVRGDGIFESLLVRDGRPCLLEAHLARLTQSARMMDLPAPDLPRWRSGRRHSGVERGSPTAATRRCCGWCTAADGRADRLRPEPLGRRHHAPPSLRSRSCPRGWPALVARVWRRLTLARGLPADGAADMPWLLAGAKTLSYAVNMAALRHAERHGAGDVIFVSSDGYILEGPRSTVVIATELETGPETPHCSPRRRGIRSCAAPRSRRCSRWPGTRATTVTTAPCVRLILFAAQGVWLVSSITLAARVHTLDGKLLPPAPLADEIAELVDAAIVSDR